MKYVNVFFFRFFSFFLFSSQHWQWERRTLKIYFVAKDGDRARTYLGN